MDPRLPRLFFVLVAAFGILQFWHDYALLPNIVASHFNAAGEPNGWQNKQGLFNIFMLMMGLSAGLVFVIPPIVARSPSINLPNREYWLTPERRKETVNFLSASFGWFGCSVLVLLLLVFRFAIEFNLHPTNPPDPARLWYYLVAFIAFAVGWLAYLVLRFTRVPPDSAKTPGAGQGFRK